MDVVLDEEAGVVGGVIVVVGAKEVLFMFSCVCQVHVYFAMI